MSRTDKHTLLFTENTHTARQAADGDGGYSGALLSVSVSLSVSLAMSFLNFIFCTRAFYVTSAGWYLYTCSKPEDSQ